MRNNDGAFYRSFRKMSLPERLLWKPLGDPRTLINGTLWTEKINNPLLYASGNQVFLYRGGQDGERSEILADTQGREYFDPLTGWEFFGRVTPASFFTPPDKHLDPAVCHAHGKFRLFWSQVGQGEKRGGRHRIGLATSTDGLNFTRVGPADGIMDGRAPEIVFHNDTFHLFVELRPRDRGQPESPPGNNWCLYYLFTSDDGVHFHQALDRPVIPPGPSGDWDSFNIATLRIVREEEYFYMLYCASDRTNDWLQNVGIARSLNLTTWEKSPMNPVFGRCVDDWLGSCWYPTSLRIGTNRYFMYEYTGIPLAEPETAYGKPRRTPKFVRGLSVLSNVLLREYFP